MEFYRGLGIRVTYMPNPVDLSVGREKMASLDSFSMLWMGRISEEKNPAAAVEIAARVIKEVPEAELLIVGKGDEALTGQLKNRMAEADMEEKILLCGFQERSVGTLLSERCCLHQFLPGGRLPLYEY